jgi:hypothetical protein
MNFPGILSSTVSQAAVQASGLNDAARMALQVLQTRDIGSIAGASWVAFNGLRGVLRRESPVDAAKLPLREDGFRFADRPPIALQLLRAALGQEHVAYNLWGLYETFRSVGVAQGEYARIVGLKKYFADYLAIVADGTARLPGEPRFVEAVHALYSEWVMRYARSNGLNVRFEGTEKIPAKGHVVYALAPHVAIYPDFFFTYADPMLVPVADAYNFRDNPGSKISGVSLVVDKTSLPLVDREDPLNEERTQHLFDTSLKHGLRPAWFINGGRVARMYRDDGSLARPSVRGNSPDAKKPDRYFQTGGVFSNALGLAKKSREPVTILVATLRGTECMPKVARKFPFIQRNRSGGEVVYRVVDAIVINPTESIKKSVEIDRRITQLVRQDLDDDAYLEEYVSEWGRKRGREDAVTRFHQRAAANDGFYTIVARTACIPPSQAERNRYIESLFSLVFQQEDPDKKQVSTLLAEVTESFKKAQYL